MLEKIISFTISFAFIIIILYFYIFTNFMYSPYTQMDGSFIVNTAPDNLKVIVDYQTKEYYPLTPRVLEYLKYNDLITETAQATLKEAQQLGFSRNSEFDCFSYSCGLRCEIKKVFNQKAIPWDRNGDWQYECL